MVLIAVLLLSAACLYSPVASINYIGCFGPSNEVSGSTSEKTSDFGKCIAQCRSTCKKFAKIQSSTDCLCDDFPGYRVDQRNCNLTCSTDAGYSCGSTNSTLSSVYDTGILGLTYGNSVNISNVTDSSVRIAWSHPPAGLIDVKKYEVKAVPGKTYATYTLQSLTWGFSSNTNESELSGLHPATVYEFTVTVITTSGMCVVGETMVQTEIADPDERPSSPRILAHENGKIIIKVFPVTNNNGPVSSYQIVVINENQKQVFQNELVDSYNATRNTGVSYYVTAEIPPEATSKEFVVGDGVTYGGYYNAPLEPNTKYSIHVGIVSKKNGITKVLYSLHPSKGHSRNNLSTHLEEDSALITGLIVVIVILSCLLVGGVVGYILLKRRIEKNKRRQSEEQGLSMRGPILELENSCYIPDEEAGPVNYYANLTQQVWQIPRRALEFETSSFLGWGKYGQVVKGSVRQEMESVQVAVYLVEDGHLNSDDKRTMLKELDLLIKVGKHENVIALIGTCETPDTVHIVMECPNDVLKEMLLGSRQVDNFRKRFCSLTNSQVLNFAVGIAKGMEYMVQKKIVHKQICARNVLISSSMTPKISGYGLSDYNVCGINLDYKRWTAHEVFRGRAHDTKSDVWSFGCLLWEMCTLGGTPYSSVLSASVSAQVMAGLRLQQLEYFSDDLYQVMLDCWQVELSERPSFQDLIQRLQSLIEESMFPHLNFHLFPGFQYEPYVLEMELVN